MSAFRIMAAGGTFALTLLLASPGFAGAIEDGNAGLDALNRGDTDAAIRLFTRALTDKHMGRDDREFAYMSRAKAYQAKGDVAHATADLRSALKLKPDDDDAQQALETLLRPATPVQAAAVPQPPRDPWGFYAAIAGKYYWFVLPGKDPHLAFYHAEWVTQGQVLSAAVRNKRGPGALYEIKLDPATGKLMEADIVTEGSYYSTDEASSNQVVSYGYFKETPLRATWRLQPDGSINWDEEQFEQGAWKATSHAQMVEVSEDVLAAAGFLKKKKK